MPYGRITSSSGRTLNLSPEGWINNEGENLNAGANQLAVMLDYASPKVQLANGVTGYRGKGANAKNLYDAEGNMISEDFMVSDDKKRELQAFEMERQLAESKKKLLDAQAQKALQGESKWEVMQTPNGAIRVDRSTGRVEPIMVNGQPVGKEVGQAQKDADAVMDISQEAAGILPKAHGSYIGTGFGALANVFGLSSDQNKADAQLKVLAGALISKMPKMSGPQSDKDVQLYRDMAGQIGDSTISIDTRLAALETVRKLNAQYANPSKVSQGQGKPSGATDAQLISEARKAVMQGKPRDAVVQRLESWGITNHGI